MSSKVRCSRTTRPAWSRWSGARCTPTAGSRTACDAGSRRFAARSSRSLQQQYEQRAREAHAAGMREGEAAGRNARRRGTATGHRPAGANHRRDLADLRARLRAEAEADLVKLSLAIARRVLRRELAIDPEALHGLILGALEKLSGAGNLPRTRSSRPRGAGHESLRRSSASDKRAKCIRRIRSRELGTVIFETQRGNLDASVESQLQEIERGLADRLRRQT